MNRTKLFIAGGLGNLIEVYETIVYIFLHSFITKTFFPENMRDNNLLFFLTVILPFLARPLGSLFFGLMGDLKGRKTVLEVSMIVSGLSCCAIAIIPSYQDIGLLSFGLVLLCRFIFGFAMSGEYNNSFLFLAEHSAPINRGYILSWAAFGVSFGICLATITALTFSHLVNSKILPEWSFRLIFLFSSLTLLIGYVARRHMNETLEFFIYSPKFTDHKTKLLYQQAQKSIKTRPWQSLKIIFLTGFGTHMTYSLFFFAPFHLTKVNLYSPTLTSTTILIAISSFFSALTCPFIGKLSDKIGRKLILLGSILLISILYLLFFFKLAENCSFHGLVSFYIVFGIFCGLFSSVVQHENITSLPKEARSTVNGLLYGIPAVIFGAMSLPYLQVHIQNYSEAPLVILVLAIPLWILLTLDKTKLFKPPTEYAYSLENIKVS